MPPVPNARVFAMLWSSIYPLYVQKAERKGRSKQEVDQVIEWLTGYTHAQLQQHVNQQSTLEQFFGQAPGYNLNASKITGIICGHRVEEIEDPLMRQIRQLDKLIDELAKGRPIEKILRT